MPYLHWFTSRRFFDVLTFHVAFVYTQHEATRILRRDQMSLVLVTLRHGLKSLPPAGENVVFHVTLASKLAQKDSRSMCCKTATLAGERGLGLRFFPPVFFGHSWKVEVCETFLNWKVFLSVFVREVLLGEPTHRIHVWHISLHLP